MQLGFYFDNSRCTGCRTCVLACKDYKGLDPQISYRRVYDYEGGGWRADTLLDESAFDSNAGSPTAPNAPNAGSPTAPNAPNAGSPTAPNAPTAWQQDVFMYHLSLACNHCAQPICVQVCPTGAMHKEETGLVRVDPKVCVGCGYCQLSCPYGAPHVSEVTHQSAKCDGCAERVIAGGRPVCVEACPLRALDFGDIDTLRLHYDAILRSQSSVRTTTPRGLLAAALVDAIAPMPASSYTYPNIIIRPSMAAREVGSTEGRIVNPEEVE